MFSSGMETPGLLLLLLNTHQIVHCVTAVRHLPQKGLALEGTDGPVFASFPNAIPGAEGRVPRGLRHEAHEA